MLFYFCSFRSYATALSNVALIFASVVWSTTDRLIAGNAEWQNQKSFASRISPTCIAFIRASKVDGRGRLVGGSSESRLWNYDRAYITRRLCTHVFLRAKGPGSHAKRVFERLDLCADVLRKHSFRHSRFFSRSLICTILFLPSWRLTSEYTSTLVYPHSNQHSTFFFFLTRNIYLKKSLLNNEIYTRQIGFAY